MSDFRPKILVAYSGGMDSTTLLYKAVALVGKDQVFAVTAVYGSKHNRLERLAAVSTCNRTGVRHHEVFLSGAFAGFKSDLLRSGGPVPEGHYSDASMSRTVVPCRNLIFASVLAGLADSHQAEEVWLGVHSGDHAIYPDCRPDFISRLTMTVREATEGRVKVAAPYLRMDKAGILKDGQALKVDYALTRTCYTDQDIACGRCGSCVERRSAFAAVGMEDPLPYQDPEFYKTAKPS